MSGQFIPFHRPLIGDEERDAIEAVLASGWLTTGPVTLAFERDFASYVGAKHALAVNSATTALQLALDAIGLRAGDEVLVPRTLSQQPPRWLVISEPAPCCVTVCLADSTSTLPMRIGV